MKLKLRHRQILVHPRHKANKLVTGVLKLSSSVFGSCNLSVHPLVASLH